MNPCAPHRFLRAPWCALFRRRSALACLVFTAVSAFGQDGGRAAVTGVVSNQATGDLLEGAVLVVEGAGISTATERGGRFTLALPAGVQTLVVSYAGLDSARVSLTATAGETIRRDIPLTSQVYVLDPVTVMGVREGNALAIQMQRQAMNSKTVVATDVYGNPSANPGELVQRLPGVNVEIVGSEVRSVSVRGLAPGFTQLTVDGDRMASSTGTSVNRDAQIEHLSMGNIVLVELIKAPTPDMDANAIGGYVNLITKRAFDLPGRRVLVNAGVLWRKRGFDGSPLQDRADNLDTFSLSFSDAFSVLGGKNNLGLTLDLNHQVSTTTQDEFGPVTTLSTSVLNPQSANPLQRVFGTGDFLTEQRFRNAGVSADYRFSEQALAYFKVAMNSKTQSQHYNRILIGNSGAGLANFTADSTYEHSILLPSTASTGEVEIGTYPRNNQNWQFSGGTELKFFNGDGVLEMKGNYSYSNLNVPAWTRMYANVTGVGFDLDRRNQDPWYPKFTQTAGPSLNDAGNYLMKNFTRTSYRAPNYLYGARADYRHSFHTRWPTFLKAGVKYDDDERSQAQENEQRSFVGADGLLATADDSMAPFAVVSYRQAGGRYGPWPFPGPPNSGQKGDALNVPANYWRPTASNAYAAYVASVANDTRVEEKIRSAYVLGNATVGKLRLLAGLRIEETSPQATGWLRNATASFGASSVGGATFDPVITATNVARAQKSFLGRYTQSSRYRNVFPGAHVVYEPRRGLLVRASFNRSITRAPAANLIPQVTENPDANPPGVSMGNPGLRPYTSDNFELGVEKYFEPVGVVSANVFVKQISNYFRSFVSDLGPGGIDGAGTYANYRLTQTRNIGSARIRGAEIRYDQQFSFLPGFLRGFGFSSNFTYLETEGDFGTTAVSKNLVNFRPRSGAAGLSYRGHGLQANLLAKWEDRYFGPYQDTGTLRLYQEPRTLVDLKLSYHFLRRYDAYLDIYNLFDTSPRSDVSEDGRIHFFRTKMGVGFSSGIKARF